jgi:cytoskeletal protein RodZ
MGLILLEALLALAILVAIVWWTMFSGRKRVNEPPDEPRSTSLRAATAAWHRVPHGHRARREHGAAATAAAAAQVAAHTENLLPAASATGSAAYCLWCLLRQYAVASRQHVTTSWFAT